jgi:hypothetical protein
MSIKLRGPKATPAARFAYRASCIQKAYKKAYKEGIQKKGIQACKGGLLQWSIHYLYGMQRTVLINSKPHKKNKQERCYHIYVFL